MIQGLKKSSLKKLGSQDYFRKKKWWVQKSFVSSENSLKLKMNWFKSFLGPIKCVVKKKCYVWHSKRKWLKQDLVFSVKLQLSKTFALGSLESL